MTILLEEVTPRQEHITYTSLEHILQRLQDPSPLLVPLPNPTIQGLLLEIHAWHPPVEMRGTSEQTMPDLHLRRVDVGVKVTGYRSRDDYNIFTLGNWNDKDAAFQIALLYRKLQKGAYVLELGVCANQPCVEDFTVDGLTLTRLRGFSERRVPVA